MSHVKKQNTLFRFVSLRSPELSKREEQDTRFVFYPQGDTSAFTQALKKMPRTADKTKHLLKVARNLEAFLTEKEVDTVCGKEFADVASWIASRRLNLPVEELLEKIKELTILDLETEQLLWEQLYIQTLNPSSVYVKESIIQVLVLQNLLKYREKVEDINDFIAKLPDLVNAKVVIPSELFEKKVNPGDTTNDQGFRISERLVNVQKVADSQERIKEYEELISQIETLAQKEEYKYQEEYTKAYNEAYQKYLELINALLSESKTENIGTESIGTENSEEEDDSDPSINLPRFSFAYPKPDILKNISTQISESQKEYFDELYTKYFTVEQMVNYLKSKVAEENLNIFKYRKNSPSADTIGLASYYKKIKPIL